MLSSGFLLVPLVIIILVLIAGTSIPIGTFNPNGKQRLELKARNKQQTSDLIRDQYSSQPVTEPDEKFITSMSAPGTIRVNQFG
jgi:hypothetical protein